MIIPDASVLVVALTDDTEAGEAARKRLLGNDLAAPAVVDLEVTSAIRKLLRREVLTDHRAALAISDLIDLPMERMPHTALLRRVWELNANVTPYDASYVALAELLSATLLTNDGKLARAAGPRCRIEVMSNGG